MSNLTHISEDDAFELACGYSTHELFFISDEIVDVRRWSIEHEIVFRDEKNSGYYMFYDSQPATENQEGQDRYEAIPVPVYPVTPVETTVTKYVRD